MNKIDNVIKQQCTHLLDVYCFNDKAISYIIDRYVGYLPILAALANLAAKEIDSTFYDLKSLLVDEIASVADSQGWRTFEKVDNFVPTFPYIFYVECKRFAQVSFHGDYSRITTHTNGVWSGQSIYQNAVVHIQNRLYKDGFRGNVRCLKKTTKTILWANAGEAAHLYKGKKYQFIISDNELSVLFQGSAIEPADSLLQSFVTRFTSKEVAVAPQGSNGAEEANASNAERNGSIGGENENANNESQRADMELLPKAPENPTGKRGVEVSISIKAAMPENSKIAINGTLLCSADSLEQHDLHSNKEIEINATAHGCPTGQPLETLSSQEDKVSKNAAMQVSSIETDKQQKGGEKQKPSKISDSFISSLEGVNEPEYRDFARIERSAKVRSRNSNFGYGGCGNSILGLDRHQPANLKIKEALQRLATSKSFLKEDGSEKWCVRKIARALILNSPHKLPTAKFAYSSDKVYFFVDTSGSVCQFGEFIIEMINSTQKADTITVWEGSEAHPTKSCNDASTLPYFYDFADNLQAWIQMVQPTQGSTLVFWGDLQDAHINPFKMRQVCKQYRCIWLLCLDRQARGYKRCEANQILASGFRLITGVTDAKSLAKALRDIVKS